MRVGILERPAARTHARAPRAPIADEIEDLQRREPFQPADGALDRLLAAGFEQRVAGQHTVPHRRHARLAIGLVRFHDEELVDRRARNAHVRMILRVAEHVEHHHRIGHGRKNRAQPVLAVEPFAHEIFRPLDRAPAGFPRKPRLRHAQRRVDRLEQQEPAPALMRRLGRHSTRMRRLQEQFVDADVFGIFRARLQRRQNHQRHDGGAGPV